MVKKIRAYQIEVNVFDDENTQILPDSVFLNNWITIHEDGTIFTYPMFAPIRRKERREDILDSLQKDYAQVRRYSLEVFEVQNQFLEGTGSMIFDREHKIAYACLSSRTDVRVLHKFSLLSGFNILFFKAIDKNGFEIYHTNVMMALGHNFVVCCLAAIDTENREAILNSFARTGKEILDISFEQIEQFAGNMLELINKDGEKILVLSETAYNSLTDEQILFLNRRCKLLTVNIPTIEAIGGGSARCMIAENFLTRINQGNNRN
jgi:hypothetical protein